MERPSPSHLEPHDVAAPTPAASNGVAAGEPPLNGAPLPATASDDTSLSIAHPTNVRYTVLAWACSLSMLTYIDRVCIKNVGGQMQTDLGIDVQDFGWVFSS